LLGSYNVISYVAIPNSCQTHEFLLEDLVYVFLYNEIPLTNIKESVFIIVQIVPNEVPRLSQLSTDVLTEVTYILNWFRTLNKLHLA